MTAQQPVPVARSRLVLKIREDLRHALHIEAAARQVDLGAVVEELILSHLPEALAEMQRRRQSPAPLAP